MLNPMGMVPSSMDMLLPAMGMNINLPGLPMVDMLLPAMAMDTSL